MRSRVAVLRAAILGGAAMVGLVGAHVLDYRLLFRDRFVRASLLQTTGHAYFGRIVEFAVVSAVLAAAGSFAVGVRSARGHNSVRPSIAPTAAILALIQSGGFIALEAGERVAAHAVAQQFIKITVIGVLLQVVVATITTFVLALIERAGDVVARALVGPPTARCAIVPVIRPRDVLRPRLSVFTRASPRAPPLLLSF
jgi:hypothetical protein